MNYGYISFSEVEIRYNDITGKSATCKKQHLEDYASNIVFHLYFVVVYFYWTYLVISIQLGSIIP